MSVILIVVGMPWSKTGVIHKHAQLGLPDKGRAIIGLVACYQYPILRVFGRKRRDLAPLVLATLLMDNIALVFFVIAYQLLYSSLGTQEAGSKHKFF